MPTSPVHDVMYDVILYMTHTNPYGSQRPNSNRNGRITSSHVFDDVVAVLIYCCCI